MYNIEKIANRIKAERNRLNLSQEYIANYLHYSDRRTVANWEKGKTTPSLEDLLSLCNLFDCEIGYLLCEHDTKQRATTDVSNITGLSNHAVEQIQYWNSTGDYIQMLNTILTSPNFDNLLYHAKEYMSAVPTYTGLVDIKSNLHREGKTSGQALNDAIKQAENEYNAHRIGLNDHFSFLVKELETAALSK